MDFPVDVFIKKKKNIEHNTQGQSTGTVIGRIAQSQKTSTFQT